MVTGATGFIGRPLVEALLRSGREVHVVIRNKARLTELNLFLKNRKTPTTKLRVHEIDFTDPEFVGRIERIIPKMLEVYHFGADVSMVSTPETMKRTNVDPTQAVLDACWRLWGKSTHRKIIVASTVAVYDVDSQPIREGGRFREYEGSNPYAESKQEMERTIDRFARKGLNVAVIRPSGVYGPAAPYIFPEIARYAVRGRLEKVLSKGLKVPHNVCHVNDVVRATLFVATHATNPGEAFNVSEPKAITTRQIFKPYLTHLKRPFKPEHGTISVEEISRLPRMRGYITEPHRYSTQKLAQMGFKYRYSFQRDFPETLPGVFAVLQKQLTLPRSRRGLQPVHRPARVRKRA